MTSEFIMNITARGTDSNVTGKFDSILTGYDTALGNVLNNFQIKLILRINLIPKNEGSKVIRDSDDEKFKIADWPADKWATFVRDYIRIGVEKWDNILWLRTPRQGKCLSWKRDFGRAIDTSTEERKTVCYPFGTFCKEQVSIRHSSFWMTKPMLPNIDCLFDIQITDSEPHTTISVYNITHNWENGRWHRLGPTEQTGYRSSNINYSSSDITEETMHFHGTPIHFLTSIHEIGHSLGLDHIGVLTSDPKCLRAIRRHPRKGSNQMICYGISLHDARSRLGKGMEVSELLALPWQIAAEKHTGLHRAYWGASTTRLYPEYI